MPVSQEYARLWRALISLEGLAVGDAFGELFFSFAPSSHHRYFADRLLPDAPQGSWRYTDDTQMALSVVETLRRCGSIDQDWLAGSFAAHYEPSRGYGANMHQLLHELRADRSAWRTLAPGQFSGHGSYGNGAAMRVAPLGAYFADDLQRVVEQARLSAEVTHSHLDAVAGAIAVAVGAQHERTDREAGSDSANGAASFRVSEWHRCHANTRG